MQRKKISTGINNAAAVVELDDDEQLVEEVTTTKRVGRQRRIIPPPDEPITVEPIEDDDDDEPPTGEPLYSDTSLAALIYGEGEDAIDNQFCTVVIRRNPDSINDRFATPCTAQTNLPAMRNVELTAERMDIEERVRSEFGGGHYFFQLHFNNRLQTSWKATLSDPPISKTPPPAVAAEAPAQPPAPAAPAVDAFDNFLENLEKQKRMRDLLFGDEQRRLEKQIEELKVEAAKPQPPAAPQSETLVILEKALASPNQEISDRLLEYAFPTDKGESRHWIAELASVVMDNKDTIAGVLGSLLGAVPQPAAAAPPNVAEMMRMQPPPSLPKFSRTKPETAAGTTAADPPLSPADEPDLVTAEPPAIAGNDAPTTAELPIIDVEETPEPAPKARGKAK